MEQPIDGDPEAYYDNYGAREWERLDRDLFHRLEWEGTIEQLDRWLPSEPSSNGSPAVLDAGGGPGRYSVWLANAGYDVTLVDISETQRSIAREKITEQGLSDQIAVERGDVRNLSFEDNAFDATCCLGGPLSHVLDDDQRAQAFAELRRVTTPGGLVFISVMGLLGAVSITVQLAGTVEGDDDDLDLLPDLVREQEYTAALAARHGKEAALFDCHFFRRNELEQSCLDAGLEVETIVALEGVGGVRRTEFDVLDDTDRASIRELNDLLRTDPAVVDFSPHMLAVCRVSTEE